MAVLSSSTATGSWFLVRCHKQSGLVLPSKLAVSAAERVVSCIGSQSVPRLFIALCDLQRGAAKELQWLPLLACWLSNANESRFPVHPPSDDSKDSNNAKESLNAPDAAHLLGPATQLAGWHKRAELDPAELSSQHGLSGRAEEALWIQAGF